MEESKILYNIKKEFYDMVVAFHNEYSQDKTKANIERYENMLRLYKVINSCKSLDEIKGCLQDIQKEIAVLKTKYNEKVDEYKKDKKESTLKEIKEITKVAQGLTDAYSKANHMLSKRTKEVKKTPVVPKVEEKTEQKIVPKKIIDTKDVDFDIQQIKEIDELTKQIISLKDQIAPLDPMSKEATELRKKINDLCNQRMQITYEQLGYMGINYIRNLESLETRYSLHNDRNNSSSYEVNAEQYATKLEELLIVIADLKFNGIKSQYVKINENMDNKEKLKTYQDVYSKYMNEYFDLVQSLYDTKNPKIYINGDYSVTSTDLLNYLAIYNLKGGYQTFKEHHKSGKIGNEAVTKELYSSGLDKIEGFISSFKIVSKDLIQNKGGKITIQNQNITKEDMKFEIEQKMADLYKMITKKQQEKTM